MKILHVLDHSIPLQSGYTFRSRSILEHQRAMGWETVHLTSAKHQVDPPPPPLEEVDGLSFYRTPLITSMEKIPVANQLGIVRSLEKRLAEVVAIEKPDLIHAHSPCLNGVAALRVGRRAKLPVVYECRAFWEDAAVDHGTSSEGGIRYRLTRALETYVFKHADRVTTICEGLRGDIVARGVPGSKITVIPNAVDLAMFNEDTPRDTSLGQSLGLGEHLVLGFIGSFYAYEGLSLLIDSLPRIIEKRSDVRLLLVGGGPQEESLKRQVTSAGLSDVVVFTGRVPHAEVSRYYSLVDVFVYPRISMRLTELVTPLKPLEAMAQRDLVVASDIGGHRELIRDGENGRLFEAGNAEALANAILGLASDKESWPKLRAAGRSYVETERSWPVSVGNYREVYEGLVA